mgnify:CR=1 FL=1
MYSESEKDSDLSILNASEYLTVTGIKFLKVSSNFKELETSFGPIQKLYARETDILTLQEDKISYVQQGKDLLSDAVGGGAVVSTPEVLGKQIARIEEYGISFNPVPANGKDTITLPKGFSWHKVASWGDPLWSGFDDFDQITRGTGESQEGSFGDNNDGMSLFDIEGKSILAVNNLIHKFLAEIVC